MPLQSNGMVRSRGRSKSERLVGAVSAVERMVRIKRPTIEAYIRAKPTRLDKALRAIVTMLAERLERAEPELVDIAMVRLDMVADRRGHDDAAFQAILAKRMREQLVPPDPRPAPRAVPSVPLRPLAAKRLIPLTQVNLYVVGAARGPACAFARIASFDDVPIAGGFVVGGEPEQRFE
jgi:hypothetical protein